METTKTQPKITIETEPTTPGVLIVGDGSPLAVQLREILTAKGIKINDPHDFDYIFQLGEFRKVEFFLEKAARTGAKFFLILNEQENKEAEQRTKEYLQNRKLQAKIIKLSGFAEEEIEAIKKILKITLSQTAEKVISLKGPRDYFREKTTNERRVYLEKIPLWGALFFLLFLILTSPITLSLTNIFLGTWALNKTKTAILSSNFDQGKRQAKLAESHFTSAKNGFEKISGFLTLLGKEDLVKTGGGWLEISQELARVSGDLIEIGQKGERLALIVLGQEQGRVEEILAQITADISLAQRDLALIEAQSPTGPSFLAKNFAQMKSLRKGLLSLESFLPVAPWVLGIEKKRTYLLLLQNNFELRPGGGFIGTIGLLTLAEGKMDLKIEDVYTADGQLRGHVEPPRPIKEYLNQIHWYLRDSNWDPDFTVNGQKAAWFLEKELGIKPDGVVAFDLSLAQKILKLTGPVELSDYQEKITADNLFLKTQIYTQENFFPGSTQKRDFLSSLATAIFTKLTTKNTSWLGIAKSAQEAVQEKHLFVYLNNETGQKIISEQGWGGEVKSIKYQVSSIKYLDDYLMIVEANLGVNKANYFLKREIKKEVNFTEDGLISKVTITYENTSPANVSFAGIYKNYLRILTAPKFTLEKISIDGQNLGPDKIDEETLAGKNTTGFLVEVGPGTKKKVELSYKTTIDPPWNEFTYQLLIQKQPGTDKDPLVIESNFGLSYNGDLSIDRPFVIKVKK